MRTAILLTLVILAGANHAAPQPTPDAEKLMKASDCSSCHAADRQVVGPAYSDIAKRYAGQAGAAEKLSAKIREGGGGMTAHPDLSDAQRAEIVKWILSQKDAAGAPQGETKSYSYALKDGTTANLDFPVFLDASNKKVTKDVFHGYQLYNSYCYRCHGTDATGGQLGPDLRRSLAVGMKQRDFLGIAMAGRNDKGMPAWAGFLS